MKEMYVIVFETRYGTRCETHCCTEEEARKRYWELDENFEEVHLLSVKNESEEVKWLRKNFMEQ